ncbi:LysR family transcriptional regulator [Pigmentiphaga soli]|uniref:LysR family transcriptional regulator n=1 Tax=Pigmentiphaga soli TaxID=1007095 RepID=UPI0031EEBCE5
MELKRIRYFLAVAEELHFGRAAARLNMSQPPLSEQIRLMEEDTGIRLFDRSTQGVRLTAAGSVLYDAVRRGVQIMDLGVHSARLVAAGQGGRLVIGFVSSASITIVPRLVRHLTQSLPAVEPQLRQYGSAREIEEDLVGNALDIGLVRPPVVSAGLTAVHLIDDAMLCALPDVHPLAKRKSIAIEELATERFIMFSSSTPNNVNLLVQRACARADFIPRVSQYVNDVYAMVGLVASGLGVALVPRSLANLAVHGAKFVPVRNVVEQFTLSVAWRADERMPVVRRAAETIIELFAGAGKAPASFPATL